MLFRDFQNDTIAIERGDRTATYEVSFQGKKIYGPLDMEVEEGDALTQQSTHERFIVSSVERHKAPARMSQGMSHCVLAVMYEAQPRKKQEEARAAPQITQHIGSAHTVTGRDIHGGVNTTITVTQIFDAIAVAIDEDKVIPEAEKKTILGRIKSLATNPYVMAVVPPLIVEALKKRIGI